MDLTRFATPGVAHHVRPTGEPVITTACGGQRRIDGQRQRFWCCHGAYLWIAGGILPIPLLLLGVYAYAGDAFGTALWAGINAFLIAFFYAACFRPVILTYDELRIPRSLAWHRVIPATRIGEVGLLLRDEGEHGGVVWELQIYDCDDGWIRVTPFASYRAPDWSRPGEMARPIYEWAACRQGSSGPLRDEDFITSHKWATAVGVSSSQLGRI